MSTAPEHRDAPTAVVPVPPAPPAADRGAPVPQHPRGTTPPPPPPRGDVPAAWWTPQAEPAPASAPATQTQATRTRWAPLVGTAAAAALLASIATAGLTTALDDDAPAPAAASQEAPADDGSSVAPVASSDGTTPDWQAVAEAVRPSVVAIEVQTASGSGAGSGVVLDAEGHVLTNDHVVGDAVDGGLRVTLSDGRVYGATIVGLDPATDLAVIQLTDPPADLVAAEIGDSDALAVGDAVMAVGNPLGLDSTATTGIVSALDRPVSTAGDGEQPVVTNAIQVDAAVNPGNSGGPLFDAEGRVVGINSSIASFAGPSGQAGSIGLGFAIPSALAERIAAELIEDGAAEHAFLGVSLTDGTATADGETRRGAVVQEVSDGSPAGDAGVQVGDVVVAIDGDPVSGAESLTAFVREHAAGDVVTLTVVRDDAAVDVDVTLAVRQDAAATAPTDPQQGDVVPGSADEPKSKDQG